MKPKYWSLDCDIIEGPTDAGVKVATAATPEWAKFLADALNGLPPEPVVTCAYCGHEYPEGTPTAKAEALTAHIKTCEAHPMRKAEATIARLRSALAGLIGASEPEELRAMQAAMKFVPAPDPDAKRVGMEAIDALLETAEA